MPAHPKLHKQCVFTLFTSVQQTLLSSHIHAHRLTYPNRYLTDSWNGWKNPVVLDADDVPVAPSEDSFARLNPGLSSARVNAAPPTGLHTHTAKRGSSYRIDVRSPKRIRHPPTQQRPHATQEVFPRPPVELAQFPHDLSPVSYTHLTLPTKA